MDLPSCVSSFAATITFSRPAFHTSGPCGSIQFNVRCLGSSADLVTRLMSPAALSFAVLLVTYFGEAWAAGLLLWKCLHGFPLSSASVRIKCETVLGIISSPVWLRLMEGNFDCALNPLVLGFVINILLSTVLVFPSIPYVSSSSHTPIERFLKIVMW